MANKNKPVSASEAGAGETGKEEPGLRTGVVGTVRSPDGEPVSGAVIVARSLDTPTKAIPEIAIVTNEHGSFAWPLRPGRYELAPMLDGRRGDFLPVTVAPKSVTRLDLVFAR
ncbi:carboxypeptidase-like regulatory domain-containing protein [Microbaculum marinisediminis]|uniref:Carboxypeptidase-like regulatory domain-containing protein n=1 Tax=Microbaculum marinisediminis TaxID=2931392 RepID=A0AAW5QZL7_9HYPH|nr:carboxypeptidase-like regulatory domain-containing protein [Microbaculum sp. A6E488]MCT8971881.1 carboxypeptidase-like regulatory domain-containing protein [Microbaculum sp. A6E488]